MSVCVMRVGTSKGAVFSVATLLVAVSGNGKLCALWEAEIAATAMRVLIDDCIWF
tara:strand:- start:25849 stop:26013 length:165 start_codon:yes stop_codon:yes gene_type:complete